MPALEELVRKSGMSGYNVCLLIRCVKSLVATLTERHVNSYSKYCCMIR